MTLTRNALTATVATLAQTIEQWLDSERTAQDAWLAIPKGPRPTATMPKAIEDGLRELFTVTSTADVAEDAQAIVFAVDLFRADFLRWTVVHDMMRPGDPRHSLTTWGTVLATLTPPPSPRKPRRIADMVREGMPVLAIAKHYGWYTPEGKADTQKAMEEIAVPGTHYNPATYTHPTELRAKREACARWAARVVPTPPPADDAPTPPTTTPRPVRQPCSESIMELASLPRMTAKAIAAKKCCTLAEVEAAMVEAGFGLGDIGGRHLVDLAKAKLNPRAAQTAGV
ncbi:MAG: hypothetical protein NTY19_26070 [Planctomycetota bacterium]|nr:hypothetical protein [Planctomycetota bacterium]